MQITPPRVVQNTKTTLFLSFLLCEIFMAEEFFTFFAGKEAFPLTR